MRNELAVLITPQAGRCLASLTRATSEAGARGNKRVNDIRVHGGLLDLRDAVPVDTTALQTTAVSSLSARFIFGDNSVTSVATCGGGSLFPHADDGTTVHAGNGTTVHAGRGTTARVCARLPLRAPVAPASRPLPTQSRPWFRLSGAPGDTAQTARARCGRKSTRQHARQKASPGARQTRCT